MAGAAAVEEKISSLQAEISKQKVRIASLEKVKMTEKYLQKFRKIKNQNEKLRDEKKKIKVQMKEIRMIFKIFQPTYGLCGFINLVTTIIYLKKYH